MDRATIPTLTTPSLTLRPFNKRDAEPLYEILQEKNLLRYYPNPKPPNREKVRKLITQQLDHWEEHGYGWWAVEMRTNKQLIGWCGLQYLPDTEEVEVAYLLSKAYWGRGLATEGARASLQYGFEQLGLECIVGIVHPGNVASQRVLEKAGLTFVEQARYFEMECYRFIKHRPY